MISAALQNSSRRSNLGLSMLFKRALAASFVVALRALEHHRLASIQKDTTLEMKPHGPRQNSRLDVAPNGDKIVRGRRVRHPFGLLFDDRALT
jgi:hypothetical protein